jgi:hypothetical protein
VASAVIAVAVAVVTVVVVTTRSQPSNTTPFSKEALQGLPFFMPASEVK